MIDCMFPWEQPHWISEDWLAEDGFMRGDLPLVSGLHPRGCQWRQLNRWGVRVGKPRA